MCGRAGAQNASLLAHRYTECSLNWLASSTITRGFGTEEGIDGPSVYLKKSLSCSLKTPNQVVIIIIIKRRKWWLLSPTNDDFA